MQIRGFAAIREWVCGCRSFKRSLPSVRPELPDRLPNLSIVRLSNDHTDGIGVRRPTPQFYVADNDYALGLLVEAVSNSPYWKDTCIAVVEDDAQDGPDHVDAHRSVALLISAYNRPGALIHEFHNTVSLIRTIELLLGIEPMNQLDATATPINIFRAEPDLRPYKALLPNVALDNLVTPPPRDAAAAYWMRRTEEQDLERADMARSRDPESHHLVLSQRQHPDARHRPPSGIRRHATRITRRGRGDRGRTSHKKAQRGLESDCKSGLPCYTPHKEYEMASEKPIPQTDPNYLSPEKCQGAFRVVSRGGSGVVRDTHS